MEINRPQEEAIKTIDENIVVNAGAGTGKTRVLSKRFIEILDNGDLEYGKEIESIVAITFTKKASREMTLRIREEIREKINEDKDEKWNRFYRDMEKANISTIHGFCSKILRDRPIESKVDPLFEVLEDYTAKKLLRESVEKTLESYLMNSKEFYRLLRILNINTIDELTDDIVSIYNDIRTLGEDFSSIKKLTLENIKSNEILDKEIEEIRFLFLYLMDSLGKASKIVKMKEERVWVNFRDGNYEESELSEIIPFLMDNMSSSKKEQEKIDRLNYLLNKAMESFEVENIWAYELILDILEDLHIDYSSRKKRVKGLDYDDLQIKVLDLFENDYILNYYSNKYSYIMIDEYQDTNELQRKIFYKLATINKDLDKNNLFVVGDPKQSIYGFRGADIDVFYNTVEDISSNGKLITLEKNYRTVDTILNFINNTFDNIMGEKYNPLDFNKKSNSEIDVYLIEKEDLETPEEYTEGQYAKVYESKIIASEIDRLIEEERYEYGDIALLFRASSRTHIYEKALEEFNIPYYNSSGRGFYSKQEIIDIINGMKFISNTRDKISAIGFLRSPLIGLNDNSIYSIVSYGNIYEALFHVKLDGVEEEKRIYASELIKILLHKKSRYSIYELVEYLLEETYFREKLLLEYDGKQSLANVNKFMNIIDNYELKNSLDDFIAYIDEIRVFEEPEGEVESENANVVKIMTIHKSKGLEFPVVVLPEMSIGSNNNRNSILLNKEIGLGMKLGQSTGIYDKINNIEKQIEDQEMERILYVAMTRAEEKLIIGNQGNNQGFKKILKSNLGKDNYKIIDSALSKSKESNRDEFNFKNILEFDSHLPSYLELDNFNIKTVDRINISQYMVYEKCKMEYFMTYLNPLNIDELNREEESNKDLISPIDRGNIVHKFCEDYRIGMNREELLKDIIKNYGFDYSKELLRKLKPYIDNYIEFYNEDYDEILREQEFYLKVHRGYITGIIDSIYIKGDTAYIVDYKTNKVYDSKEIRDSYTPQIQLYGYIVKKYLDIKNIKGGIFLLEKGIYEEVSLNNEDLERNYEKILEFYKYINKYQDISNYNKSEKCNTRCRFYNICN